MLYLKRPVTLQKQKEKASKITRLFFCRFARQDRMNSGKKRSGGGNLYNAFEHIGRNLHLSAMLTKQKKFM